MTTIPSYTLHEIGIDIQFTAQYLHDGIEHVLLYLETEVIELEIPADINERLAQRLIIYKARKLWENIN
jgi:hypothetical protein